MPSLAHTVTSPRYSHCAFTELVRVFCPMMAREGFGVTHYGVEGAELATLDDPTHGVERVTVLTRDEQHALLEGGDGDTRPGAAAFVGRHTENDALHELFNARLRVQLEERVQPGDLVCLPFGWAHRPAVHGLPVLESGEALVVEITVGQNRAWAHHRIYPTEAWRHYMFGFESRDGMALESPRTEWVIPHFLNVAEWPVGGGRTANGLFGDRPVALYFGRLTEQKGVPLIPRLARERPHVQFVLCGQGDPSCYLTEPNVVYHPPVAGAERAALLGSAMVLLAPTRYVEPFNLGVVQAMACGTPVLASPFGSFTEIVSHGHTGFRCTTLGDWLEGIDAAVSGAFDRLSVARMARNRFGTAAVGSQYTRVFRYLAEIMKSGSPMAARWSGL